MIYLHTFVILATLLLQGRRYSNPVEGYSIQFPKGWSVVEEPKHVPAYTGAYSPKADGARYAEIKVVVLPNMAPADLVGTMQQDIDLTRSISGQVNIERNQAIQIGPRKGRLVQLTFTSPELGLIRLINYGFARHNRLYFIRCLGNQAYFKQSANEVQKACSSFRID